jgi:hypothetical protein
MQIRILFTFALFRQVTASYNKGRDLLRGTNKPRRHKTNKPTLSPTAKLFSANEVTPAPTTTLNPADKFTSFPTTTLSPTFGSTQAPTTSPTAVASVDDATLTELITTGENRYIAPGPNDLRGPCPALNTLANHGFINRDGRNLTQAALQNAMILAYKFAPQDALVHVFNRGFGISSFTGDNGNNQTDLHLIASHQLSIVTQGRIIEHDSSLTRLDSTVEGGGEGDSIPPQIPINPQFLATFLSTPGTLNKKYFDVEVMYKARVVSLARSYRKKGKCGRNVASVGKDGAISNINGYYFNNSFVNPTEGFPSFVEAAFVLSIFGGRQGMVQGSNNNTASIKFVQSFFQYEKIPASFLRAADDLQLADIVALAQTIYNYGPQISPPPCTRSGR